MLNFELDIHVNIYIILLIWMLNIKVGGNMTACKYADNDVFMLPRMKRKKGSMIDRLV